MWYRKAPRAADRPDRVDPRLLPPARLRRVVEPAVRPARLRAVPVRAAVRRRRPRCAQVDRAPRRRRARRASSACSSASGRPTRRRSASPSRAGRWPLDVPAATHGLAGAAARARRPRARRRRPPLPGQGRPHHARGDPPRLPAPRRVAGDAGAPPTPAGCGPATSAAGCACSTTDPARRTAWRTPSEKPRRSSCSAARATSGGPSSTASSSPATRTVVLAGRRPGEMRGRRARAARASTVDGRALRRHRHRRPRRARPRPRRPRTATSTSSCWRSGSSSTRPSSTTTRQRAAEMVTVNYTGAVSSRPGRRRPVPPPGPRPARRAVERRRRAGAQGELRLRLVEGRARRLRPGPRRRPRRLRRQRARRAPGLRALPDDRGHEGGAVRHDAGRRGRRHRQGAAPRAAARCGCRPRCAPCSACSATCPARSGAASRSADARSDAGRPASRLGCTPHSDVGADRLPAEVADASFRVMADQTFPPLQYDFMPEVPSFTVVSDDFTDGERSWPRRRRAGSSAAGRHRHVAAPALGGRSRRGRRASP